MTDFMISQPQIVTALIFCAFSVAISIYDARTMAIPDILTLMAALALFCYRLACTRRDLLIYALAALLAVLLLFVVRYFSRRGLGWGDVKYGAVCGLYAGPVAVFAGFFLAAVLAAALNALRRNGAGGKEPIPFAPFMAAGTFAVSLFALVPAVAQLLR